MKILLSAYACEPNKGSEPGVGWNWAIELSRLGHKIWVITRQSNRRAINSFFSDGIKPTNLNFIFFDLPDWAKKWKKGRRFVHLYYLLWQWGAYCLAKKKHREILFDLVHHVTFVSIRQPSFMGNLGIPFIFGPVAGGEHAPWRLRLSYNLRGFIIDAVRDLANLFVIFDPLMHHNFSQATKIIVTSEDTLALIPFRYRHKALIQLAIGVDGKFRSKRDQPNHIAIIGKNKLLRILYVGHFLYWKGMHLGLRSFDVLLKSGLDARLTIVGKGPDEYHLRALSKTLGVSNRIDWISWVSQDQLSAIYSQHDVFLFPSLHDSGGMVVLEALGHGLPVICFGIGGPGQIVNSSCGLIVSAAGLNSEKASNELARALETIGKDSDLREQLKQGAIDRAKYFRWSNIVGRIYEQKDITC